MTSARITSLPQWRALLGLLWEAGRWRMVAFGFLTVLTGLLPTAVILATGALASAVPGAMQHGLDSAGGPPALSALGVLVLAMAALSVGGNLLVQACRVLDTAFALEVHHAIARAALGSPRITALHDPVFADQLHAIQEAERRTVLRRTAFELSNVVTFRLRGVGAFVVLLGFAWWAPLVLAAAWHLTNRAYLRVTERGVSVDMSTGAVRLRRAEYLRALAVESSAAKEVRIFGLDRWIVGRYGDAWMDALSALWQARRASRGLTAAATLALVAAHLAVLGALGAAVGRGQLDAAALLVFAQAVLATSDLGMIGESQWYLAQSLAVAQRVGVIRSRAAAQADPSPAAQPSAATGAVTVRLDDVRFTYPGRETPTLDGLSLHVPAGQSLAVVGENGAGKSTLIKLLCGLYEPDAGRVSLDGVPPLRARGRIAAIFQDFVRYALPLRENVAFGSPGLMRDEAALSAAVRDAGAGGVLEGLPRGWDTVLSREFEGGMDLSGGQWQRIALARALAAVRGGAGVLILDEPTAALDVRAETELFERFLEVTRGVTTILVSHRLGSVRRADRIVVVDGGRVVEDGTHDALMAAGGMYARMYTVQAERFALAAGEEVGHA